MKFFRKRGVLIVTILVAFIFFFIIGCTSNSKTVQDLNKEGISRVYSVFSTETIVAASVKPLEDNSDLIYLLYESSSTNTGMRSTTTSFLMEGLYALNTKNGSTAKATDTLSNALIGSQQLLCFDDDFVYINGNTLGSVSETGQLNWENEYSNSTLLSLNLLNDPTHGKVISLFMKNAEDEFICVLINPVNGETLSQTIFENFTAANSYYGPFQGFDSPLVLSKGEAYHISNPEGLFLTPAFEDDEKIFFIAVIKDSNQTNNLKILSEFDGVVFKTTYDRNGTLKSRVELSKKDSTASRDPQNTPITSPVSDVPPTGQGNSEYYVSQDGIPQISDDEDSPEYKAELTLRGPSPITVNNCVDGKCTVQINVHLENIGNLDKFFHILYGGGFLEFEKTSFPGNEYTLTFQLTSGEHRFSLIAYNGVHISNRIDFNVECNCPCQPPTIEWNAKKPPLTTTDAPTTTLSITSNQQLDKLSIKNNGNVEPTPEPLSFTTDGSSCVYNVEIPLGYGENSIEVNGSNENGISATIIHSTCSDFRALSLSGSNPITVSDCVDGKCTVQINVHLENIGNLDKFFHILYGGEFLEFEKTSFPGNEYTLTFQLTSGEHRFSLIAYNGVHISNRIDFNVECNCPCQPPTIEWNPKNPPATTTNAPTATLSITSNQQLDKLTIKNNGNVIPTPDLLSFTVDENSSVYDIEAPLGYGNNYLEISGSNENGTSTSISHGMTSSYEALSLSGSNPITVHVCIDGECTVDIDVNLKSMGDIDKYFQFTYGEEIVRVEAPVQPLQGNKYHLTFTIPSGNHKCSLLAYTGVRISNKLTFDLECNCPCQPPTIEWKDNPPPDVITEPVQVVSILSDQELNTLTVTQNGIQTVDEHPDFQVTPDNQFQADVTITHAEGVNTVVIQGENDNGSSNVLTYTTTCTPEEPHSHQIGFAEEPPATVSNCVGDECTYTLKLSANKPVEEFILDTTYNNNQPVTIPAPAKDSDGNYPIPLTLVKGENSIVIVGASNQVMTNTLVFTIHCVCP